MKCLLYEASFAKTATRMLSHLGYEGPFGVCNKGILLYQRTILKIIRLFNKCNGIFLLYLEKIGIALSDSSGIPRVEGLHALWQSTPKSLGWGLSGGSV